MGKTKNLLKAKRLLAMFLAVAMVVTLMPTTASAAQIPNTESATEGDENNTEPTIEAAANDTESTTERDENDTEPTTEADVNTSEPATEGEQEEPSLNNEATTLDVYELIDNRTDAQKSMGYNGLSIKIDDVNLSKVVLNKNGEYYVNVYEIINGINGAGAVASYKFKEYKDSAYMDMADGEVPTKAGKYKIEITVPKAEGVTEGTVGTIDVEITKAKVTPYISVDSVTPGTLVKDVKIANCFCGKFVYSETAAESDLTITLKIKKALTGEVLPDDTVLAENQDYVYDVTVSFTERVSAEDKANYELEQIKPQKLQISELIDSVVTIELADALKDAGKITRTYTGGAVDAPVKGTEYTQKAQYYAANVLTDIVGAAESDFSYAWYKEERYESMEQPPVEAGTYYYRISYTGKTGIYEKSYSEIKVVIEPAEITVNPVIKETEVFYTGMSQEDVLSKVDYTVQDKEGKEVEIDREHFWGTSYYNNTKTQPYEPVFSLQVAQTGADGNPVKDADGNIVYQSNYGNSLDSTKTYRVIFTGQKAVYNAGGRLQDSMGVNDRYGSLSSQTDRNYTVNVSDEEIAKHTAAVTVNAGEKAEIDITAILKDGKGTESDPIKKVYDGSGIYEKRADYKKAVVKNAEGEEIVKDADSNITYAWYRNDGTSETPNWRKISTISPYDAGVYKLEIRYEDSENKYYAASKTVFYEIEKQKVKVVLTGEPKALTETEVYYFDYSQIGWEIYTVPSEGEAQKLEWQTRDYRVYLQIEKAVTDSEGKESYISAVGEKFAKGTKYRVAVDELEMNSYSLYNNYNNYEIVTDGDMSFEVYLNEPLAVTMETMGETEVKIQVDAAKLSKSEKEYDGEEFDLSADIEKGLVSTVKTADSSAVSDIELEYFWYDETESKYTDAPVNGGEYTLYASFKGNTTYKSIPKTEIVKVKITKKAVSIKPYVKEPVAAGSYWEEAVVNGKAEITGYAEKDAKVIKDVINYYFSMVDNESILKGEKTYAIKTVITSIESPYDRNYDVAGETVSFTTVRGNSAVSGYNYWGSMAAVTDKIEGMQHTITAKEGIPYCYNIYDSETEEWKNGNYLAIKIQMPLEYQDNYYTALNNAIYENSIKAAGGIVIDNNTNSGFIVALFEAKDKKEFDIRWEEGYVEHFVVDFTDAVLLSDLTQAVAPKTIAFNSPVTKMVVGGEQVLDVKLTKAQADDIIRLAYESDNKEVLAVDSQGYVTALKKGSATITVYPVKLVNGKMIKIEGAKTAKVKITVNDVTAPKIKKVTATDKTAIVQFSYVSDGYRREIYVLEGKNIKAEEFEAKITSMKNEQWRNIFAIAPVYSTGWYSVKDGQSEWLSGLNANTDYTVYVRNVSGIRKANDENSVVSSVAGNTKSFKTTKVQAESLKLLFDKALEKGEDGITRIKLSQGSTKVSVQGLFAKLAEDTTADATDKVWYSLPLTKEQQRSYVNPKLVYEVAESDGETYPRKTSLASIDKTGKIKLNGVGRIYVRVYDANTGEESGWVPLQITASANSVAAKNTSLQVGQSIYLGDLLIYKEGRKVLSGSFAKSIIEDDALTKAFADNAYFELNNGWVTAVKAGGSLNVALTDAYVLETGGTATANVTLKSTELEAVKNLKTVNTMDKYFDIQFAYTGYAQAFRITVTDARGSVMRSAYVNRYDISDSNNVYVYRMLGLTGQSKYNIKVTALYGEEASKAVSKSVKTSKMPASYVALDKNQTGGLAIYITSEKNGSTLGDNPRLESGNTYTLIAGGTGLNEGAKQAVTDTLIWSSSNTKVATVKVNAGSYTASLKAAKAGSTKIEIKSKLTKQVIARYWVYIAPVGDAYSYYGDNEPLEGNMPESIKKKTSFDQNGMAEVSLGEGEDAWIWYTAPAAGTYTFYSTGGDDTYGYLYDQNRSNELEYDDDGGDNRNFSISYGLARGQTVFLRVREYGDHAASFNVYVRAE